jgi:hypothetical protein
LLAPGTQLHVDKVKSGVCVSGSPVT